jgi:F-type H+-transporting ATPase subunit c
MFIFGKQIAFSLIELSQSLIQANKFIGAGLATCGLIGAGMGVGVVFGCFSIALSRNPDQLNVLFRYAIFGFAITEAIGLLALMMAFPISFI